MTEQNLTKLTINTLTKSQYQALYNSGDISYTEIYLITDDNGTGVYALANNVYTKAEIDDIIANLPSGGGGSGTGVDLSDYYTKSEITALLANKANTSDLSDYVEIADLANVATSGDYNDLSNKPTIPSKTSDLTNDSGYVSSSSLSTVATSGSYNDLSNKPDLTVYETKAEAFSGDYDDLSNKPDLSVYQTIANSFSGDYDDLADKPDLSIYQTIANAFSGSYNDLTDKPTIPTVPTNISSFTNDSGYQTASNVNTAIATALTGYATESYVQTAVQGLGNVFTIKGSVSTVANLPSTNNSIGDVYYVAEKQAGYIWIEIDNVAQWEELGETIDLSNYVQTSDLTWNNIQNKPTFATVATSGSYSDLSNKPTIPDAVSGTYSGSNWTSITIGNTTKSIPSGSSSAPSNMATTDTAQNITGSKTFTNTVTFSGSDNTTGNVVFTGRNPIKMTASSGYGSSTGFTLFDSNNYEKGYLQYIGRQDALYLGRWSGSSSPKYAQNIGFLSEESGGTGYRVLMPNKTSTGSSSATNNTYYIPTEITNGTTTVKASSDGIIDISSLISGGGGGTTVSGTNDGTNWTSITIGSKTYNIPSGSSSGGSTPTNMVTTDTDQSITGVKTFLGQQKLKFKRSSSSDILGFTAYDNNDNEIGNLQVANRTVSGVNGGNYTYVTLGNWSSNSTKSKLGFRIQPNGSSNSYNFVMPYGTYSDFNANTYATNADITIPCAFTDGTTTIKANASGLVDLSTLNLGGGSSTSGSAVSGTNDGTNWTSLTINGSTYAIPAGGSSSGGSSGGSAGTGAIYYHNVRLYCGNSDNAKVIEFSMLTKSATQILTMNELINQVSALQNEPYNDAVVGVIYGQVYQYNNSNNKEQILGFGLTGTSSNPNFYAVVRNNSGRNTPLNISANSSQSFTTTISWINNLQNLRGSEQAANCYDIVTGGSSDATSGGGIVDINDIPLVEGELAVKQVQLRDKQTGDPLLDENGNPITEEQLGLSDDVIDYISDIGSRVNNTLVTTDTVQDITGVKIFKNEMVMDSTSLGLTKPNGIYFSKLDSCYEKGLYAFDSTSYSPERVVGGLKFNYSNLITRNGKPSTFEYYTLLSNGEGKEGRNTPSCTGFEINRRVNGTNTPKYFLAPRPSFSDSWDPAYDTYNAYYIPMVISDGTTNYYANEQGIVTIPAGGGYTAGTGPTVTRYTGYTAYSALTSGSAYANFYMYSSTLDNYLNIEDAKEGDYVDITVRYMWNSNFEYESFRFYIPAKASSSSVSSSTIERRFYNPNNNTMETYTFSNPYSPTQATSAGNVFQNANNGTPIGTPILTISTQNRNYSSGTYGKMYATIMAVDYYSF